MLGRTRSQIHSAPKADAYYRRRRGQEGRCVAVARGLQSVLQEHLLLRDPDPVGGPRHRARTGILETEVTHLEIYRAPVCYKEAMDEKNRSQLHLHCVLERNSLAEKG